MRLLLCICAMIGSVGTSMADDLADFTKSKPPKFVFVSNVNIDKDLFKIVGTFEKTVPTVVEIDVVKDGKTVKEKVTVMKSVVENYEQDMVLSILIVTTAGGKEVPTEDISKLKGKTVVLAADGLPDQYRKLLDKDTYVVSVRPVKK